MGDIATEQAEGTGPWCSECNGNVERKGAVAVHAGDEPDDGHAAQVTFVPPSMRREAREIEAEFGGWEIDVRLGYFSAVRRGVRGARVPVAGETADEIRVNLRMREGVDEWRAKDLARAEGSQS